MIAVCGREWSISTSLVPSFACMRNRKREEYTRVIEKQTKKLCLQQTGIDRIISTAASRGESTCTTHLGHLSILALRPAGDLGAILALQNRLTVLVELDSGDDYVRGVEADGRGGPVGFIAVHAVDVDDPFFAVHLSDLALPTLVLAAHDQDLVVLAYG